MNTQRRYSPGFRERALRLTEEQQKYGQTQWAALRQRLVIPLLMQHPPES